MQQLSDVLASQGLFTLVERSRITEVLSEQGFQQTGVADPTSAIEVGKLLGAQHLLMSKVTQKGLTYSFGVRLVNAETGQIQQSYSLSAIPSFSLLLSHGVNGAVNAITEQYTRDEITRAAQNIWTRHRIKKIGSLTTAVAGAGLATATIISIINYNTTYNDYLNATDNDEISQLWDESTGYRRKSIVFGISTATCAVVSTLLALLPPKELPQLTVSLNNHFQHMQLSFLF
jgi:hypothetical protein